MEVLVLWGKFFLGYKKFNLVELNSCFVLFDDVIYCR